MATSLNEERERQAHLIARASWLLSFAFLWTCLFTHSWYETEFRGQASYNVPAYNKDYKGMYGLFSIIFRVDGQNVERDYVDWGKVADDAFYRIHGAKVAATLAASVSILTALSYTRTHFAKMDVQIFTTKRMFALSCLDMILSIITMLTIALLNDSPDFNVFCDANGCFPVPKDGITNSTLGYSWGIWFARLITLIPEMLAMGYLAWTTNEDFRHDMLHEDDEPPTPTSTLSGIPPNKATWLHNNSV